jgi:hypothetical protein
MHYLSTQLAGKFKTILLNSPTLKNLNSSDLKAIMVFLREHGIVYASVSKDVAKIEQRFKQAALSFKTEKSTHIKDPWIKKFFEEADSRQSLNKKDMEVLVASRNPEAL